MKSGSKQCSQTSAVKQAASVGSLSTTLVVLARAIQRPPTVTSSTTFGNSGSCIYLFLNCLCYHRDKARLRASADKSAAMSGGMSLHAIVYASLKVAQPCQTYSIPLAVLGNGGEKGRKIWEL